MTIAVLSPNTRMTETKLTAGEVALDGSNPTVIADRAPADRRRHVALRAPSRRGSIRHADV